MQKNGFNNVNDLNQYAVQLEDRYNDLQNNTQQAFEFLVNTKDPAAVMEFVQELQRNAGVEPALTPQSEPAQRPQMAAPYQNSGQSQAVNFHGNAPNEIMAIHSAINSPEQMQRFDEAIMNTPMEYWQGLAPILIQGS